MKHIFNIIALLLLFNGLNAQIISLRSGQLITLENTTKPLDRKSLEVNTWNNDYVTILQFSKPNSKAERAKITKETGIVFLDYIPNQAYIALVPNNTNHTVLFNNDITTILPYKYQYKIDTKLLERPFPDWIIVNEHEIKVLVDILPQVSTEEAAHIFETNGATLIQWEKNRAILKIKNQDVEKIAKLSIVKIIQPTSAPWKQENLMERSNHRVTSIDQAFVTGKHYDGNGVVVAVGDDGLIGPHIDFKGRLTFDVDVVNDNGTHGDHVAGIVGGAGNFEAVAKGNANGCHIHYYNPFDNIAKADVDYNTHDVRITSLSYGQGCNDGYTSDAVDMDNLINSKLSLMSVFSAGNSGGTNCGVNSSYYQITGGYKASKNCIAVGNLQNNDQIASSSSRGPSEDGRIKPDICAVGSNVYSTQPGNSYASFTGTSMACPGVSGTLADLWHAYRSLNSNNDPYSALMKGLVLNTADDLGNNGPDFTFGFGRINARRALRVLENNQYIIDSIDNSGNKSFTCNVPAGTGQLKVMVYWADEAGLANSTNPLVNDINMNVVDPSSNSYNPWVLNAGTTVAQLSAPAIRALDNKNNVEQVTIDNPSVGTYTINISGFNIPQGPQKFVVVYDFVETDINIIYPNGGEALVPGESERIRWDAYGNTTSFNVEYSTNNGTSWSTINNNVAAANRFIDWNVPNQFTGQVKVRVTRGAQSDESDTLFSIAPIVQNISVDTACGSVFHVRWNTVPNATNYTVYLLGTKYMDVVGNALTNGFYINSGVNVTDTFYISVSANNTASGATGRRADAYEKLPGELGCLDDASSVQTIMPFANAYSCAPINAVQVKMKLKNVGYKPLSNFPVSYKINNQPIVTETYVPTLAIGDSVIFTFSTTANLSASGVYTIKTFPNLPSDINHANDTSNYIVTINNLITVQAPYQEAFESGTFPPYGFIIDNPDNLIPWQSTICMAGSNGANTHAAYMDLYNYNVDNAADKMILPILDLQTVTADSVLLSFDLAYAYRAPRNDELSILYSTDCGFTYLPTSFQKQGTVLSTAGNLSAIFSPTTAMQWKTETIDLSALKGNKALIAFNTLNENGNTLFIDNINVKLKNKIPSLLTEIPESYISLYPNPTTSVLSIETEEGKKQIDIFSTTGQKLYSETKTEAKVNIDISKYASGIYYVEIKQNNISRRVKISKL